MGMYKAVKQTFITEYKTRSPQYKARLVSWNAAPTVERIEKPTNIPRARTLGYKDKQGVIVARVHVNKGKRKRKMFDGGRKPSREGRFFSRKKSLQGIAEERAGRRFSNAEVLNSYMVGETGQRAFYEVMLLERTNPSILADKQYRAIIGQKSRAFRGLTSTAIKYRGLRTKRASTSRQRPSKRANLRN